MKDPTSSSSPVVIGGVDTHKDLHMAVVVDVHDAVIATQAFSTTRAGYRFLMRWMRSYWDIARIGVECSGSYRAGLLRHLENAGIEVLEVTPGDRADRRRRSKDDTIDARNAAHAAFARRRTVTPRARDEMVESLRVLKVACKSAIHARRTALQLIQMQIVSAPDELRDQLRNFTRMQLIRTLAAWRPDATGFRAPVVATRIALKSMARRYLELHDEITDLEQLRHALVEELAPDLLARPGIGYAAAAQLLITAGDNPDRLTSEASFAMLCGLRHALRGRPVAGVLGQDHPAPTQSGRGPFREQRPAHDCGRALAPGPGDEGPRRPEEGRGPLQPQDPQVPQALHRPRGLLPPAQPTTPRRTNPHRSLNHRRASAGRKGAGTKTCHVMPFEVFTQSHLRREGGEAGLLNLESNRRGHL
ncbi:Transposase [Kocuria rosea]|nr:Transposase [Kocuria rosea]